MFGEKLKGILRHAITALGAALLGAKAAQYLTPDMVETIAAAFLTGLGFVLSWVSKAYPVLKPVIDAIVADKVAIALKKEGT